MRVNYHTHSRWCDGRGELRDYAEQALKAGLEVLGFSGHGPLPYPNRFSIKAEEYEGYCHEARALQAEYEGRLQIRLGLEMDFIPGIQEDFGPLATQGGLDYTIGSVHLVTPPDRVETVRELLTTEEGRSHVMEHLWYIDGGNPAHYDNGLQHLFGGNIRAAVRTFFHQNNAMIERNRPTIVGHVDKVVMHNRGRYFAYGDRWFQELLMETLDLVRQLGCICELNSRGLYKGRHDDFYPSRTVLKEMDRMGIPVVVSTDAHAPEELALTMGASELLEAVGYHNIVG